MYVVKLKKEHQPPKYVCGWKVDTIKDILLDDTFVRLKSYAMTLEEAKKTMRDEIKGVAEDTSHYFGSGSGNNLEYVAVVRLSKYPPHAEMEVVDFKEF